MKRFKTYIKEAFFFSVKAKDKKQMDLIVRIAHNHYGRAKISKENPNGSADMILKFQQLHWLDKAASLLQYSHKISGKRVLKEDSGTSLGSVKQKEKETDKIKLKQKQDKSNFSDKQSAEMAAARKRDFDKSEEDKRAKETEKKNKERAKESLKEVLEDGTDELVIAYAKEIPGQEKVDPKVNFDDYNY